MRWSEGGVMVESGWSGVRVEWGFEENLVQFYVFIPSVQDDASASSQSDSSHSPVSTQ